MKPGRAGDPHLIPGFAKRSLDAETHISKAETLRQARGSLWSIRDWPSRRFAALRRGAWKTCCFRSQWSSFRRAEAPGLRYEMPKNLRTKCVPQAGLLRHQATILRVD